MGIRYMKYLTSHTFSLIPVNSTRAPRDARNLITHKQVAQNDSLESNDVTLERWIGQVGLVRTRNV